MLGFDLEVYFTRHARNRLRLWDIEPEEVIAALESPDAITSSHHERVNVWRKTERGWLRVTHVAESDRRIIITVTSRRRGPERGWRMQVTYDAEANVLYIQFSATQPVDSIDLDGNMSADLDDQGRIIGIEILDARERLAKDAITNVDAHRLTLVSISSLDEQER